MNAGSGQCVLFSNCLMLFDRIEFHFMDTTNIGTLLSERCKTHFHVPPPVQGVKWNMVLFFPPSLLLVLLTALQVRFWGPTLGTSTVCPSTHHYGMCKKMESCTNTWFLLVEVSLPMSLDGKSPVAWGLFSSFCIVSFSLDLEICLVEGAARMCLCGRGDPSTCSAPSGLCRSGSAASHQAKLQKRWAGMEYFPQFVFFQEISVYKNVVFLPES